MRWSKNLLCLLTFLLPLLCLSSNDQLGQSRLSSTFLFDFTLSSDGRFIAVRNNYHLGYWDLQDGSYHALEQRNTNSAPYQPSILPKLAFSSDSRFLALADMTNRLLVFDLKQGSNRTLAINEPITMVAFAPDDTLITTGDRLKLWDIQSNEPPRALAGDLGRSSVLAFSPDGILAVAFPKARGTHLGFWDWSSRRLLYRHRFQSINNLWFENREAVTLHMGSGLFRFDLKSHQIEILHHARFSTFEIQGNRIGLLRRISIKKNHWGWEAYTVDLTGSRQLIKANGFHMGPKKIILFPDKNHWLIGSGLGISVFDQQGNHLATLSVATDCHKVETATGKTLLSFGCGSENQANDGETAFRDLPFVKSLFQGD